MATVYLTDSTVLIRLYNAAAANGGDAAGVRALTAYVTENNVAITDVVQTTEVASKPEL